MWLGTMRLWCSSKLTVNQLFGLLTFATLEKPHVSFEVGKKITSHNLGKTFFLISSCSLVVLCVVNAEACKPNPVGGQN